MRPPAPSSTTPIPAVFLDRDGTIVEERHYLSDPAQVTLVPGAAAALVRLRAAGLRLVVVTNQSGIARGYYSEGQYQAVALRLEELLGREGARLDRTYHCPHHPEHSGPCRCRKPDTGMYRAAERDLGISLASSFYVGDRWKDVLPAAELGGAGILVRTGYGAEEERAPPGGAFPAGITVEDDLSAAASRIVGSLGKPAAG